MGRSTSNREVSRWAVAMTSVGAFLVLAGCTATQEQGHPPEPAPATALNDAQESVSPVEPKSVSNNPDWCNLASTQPAAQRILADEEFTIEPLVNGEFAVNCYFKTKTLWLVIASETPFDESRWKFLISGTDRISHDGVDTYDSPYSASVKQKTVNGDGTTSVFLMKPAFDDPRAKAAHPDMLELLTWASQNPPPFKP